MADDKDSLMLSETDQLFPNKSTGVKPRIDGFNFSGITENTLKLREYKGQYGGGAFRWCLVVSLGNYIFCTIGCYFDGIFTTI